MPQIHARIFAIRGETPKTWIPPVTDRNGQHFHRDGIAAVEGVIPDYPRWVFPRHFWLCYNCSIQPWVVNWVNAGRIFPSLWKKNIQSILKAASCELSMWLDGCRYRNHQSGARHLILACTNIWHHCVLEISSRLITQCSQTPWQRWVSYHLLFT